MQPPNDQNATLRVFAAGSLTAALTMIVQVFHQTEGITIQLETGPSGVLRERIESGAKADLFLSANLDHPDNLVAAGSAVQVIPFARNECCLYGHFEPAKDLQGLIDLMLAPRLRLGTSTPGDDPGGDYAFEVFKRVETQRPGAYRQLSAKAFQLVGGRSSKPAPAGKHAVQNLFEQGLIDLFLGYYTSALIVKSRLDGISIQKFPEAIRVETVCGLARLASAEPAADRLVDLLLSQTGAAIFRQHGFKTA